MVEIDNAGHDDVIDSGYKFSGHGSLRNRN